MNNKINMINNKTQIQIDLEAIHSRINKIYSSNITIPKELLLLIIQMAEEREELRKCLQRLYDKSKGEIKNGF